MEMKSHDGRAEIRGKKASKDDNDAVQKVVSYTYLPLCSPVRAIAPENNYQRSMDEVKVTRIIDGRPRSARNRPSET